MSQTDIYLYLKKQRITGNSKFFTIKEVSNHIASKGLNPKNTSMMLLKLYNHGFLEIRIKTKIKGKPWHGWNRKYRAKV